MNDQDEQLHRLLRQWPEIEPGPYFAAQVWRRIQHAPARPTWADWLHSWVPRPALALPAAVVAGVVIGVSSALMSVPAAPAGEQLSFLAADTLAGRLLR